MNEDDNKMVLKFRAVKEWLDWQGNVIEDVKEKDYEWYDYDPKKFLDSVIRKGDLSCVPKPTKYEYAIDFFNELFNVKNDFAWKSNEIFRKYKTIESVPFNGNKFVIYSRNDEKYMHWTTED